MMEIVVPISGQELNVERVRNEFGNFGKAVEVSI